MNFNQSEWQLFYEKIGSPSIISDGIHLFFFIPFSMFGIVLNLLVLIIISNKNKFNDTVYNHMKIFTASSILICSFVFVFAFVHIPRYASFSYSYPARIYLCTFMLPLMVISYTNLLILSILGILYRLSKFVIKFQWFENMNHNKLGFFSFLASILFNLLLFFMETTQTQKEFDEFKNNSSKLENLKICVPTSFGKSLIAQTFFNIIFTIDYIILTLIEMALFSLLLFYYNKFLKYKFGLSNLITMNVVFTYQNRVHLQLNNDAERMRENEAAKVFSNGPVISTLFYIFLNLFQIVLGILIISQSDRSNQIYNISFDLLNLVLVVKHGFVFIALYKFDSNFKSYIHSLLSRSI